MCNRVLITILSHKGSNFLKDIMLTSLKKHLSFKDVDVVWMTTHDEQKSMITKIGDHYEIKVPSSNWANEVSDQLDLLTSAFIQTHTLLMLDDFIITKLKDQSKLVACINFSRRTTKDYVRIKKDPFSLAHVLCPLRQGVGDKYYEIRKIHPYYSSLQMAVWKISYLKQLIRNVDNIWQFENIVSDRPHYIHELDISYNHIIEKGRWIYYYKSLLSLNDIKSEGLPKLSIGLSRQNYFYGKIKFFLFGYLIVIFKNKFQASLWK